MKKLFLFLAVLFFSSTVFGQTSSPVFDDFLSNYIKLREECQEKLYQEKNYIQAELLFKEMLALIENTKLPDADIPEYQSELTDCKVDAYYNLACAYSLQNKKKKALVALEKAFEFGWSDYEHTKSDSDLDNIRKEKKFIAIMEKMKVFDKLYILKHSAGYQQENTDSLPKFRYQSAANVNLKEVKNYFNLDSIAGNGDEISKIKNLLFFATKSIKYDGSNWALCEFDAIDLYNYHKTTGKGINCRHKAMVLNEMYLAMGFKSRYMTCMPEYQDDPDCHVINIVYSETLKKWLWMDPSHGIYVMDENDNLLSISEVRERLITDKPLFLNEEAKLSKEWYLDYYMAKNLYWMQCSNVSKFNTESRYRGRDKDLQYISLTPIGFGEGNRYLKDGIITHDPDYFWQLPE